MQQILKKKYKSVGGKRSEEKREKTPTEEPKLEPERPVEKPKPVYDF